MSIERDQDFEQLEDIASMMSENPGIEFENGKYVYYGLEPRTAFAAVYISGAWMVWQAKAKAQVVPEWKDYTVESPRIDGPYQIFIMNQQLVAKWESPWGFSSIEDGDALNQELITHWSVLGNDPAIEPQEPK